MERWRGYADEASPSPVMSRRPLRCFVYREEVRACRVLQLFEKQLSEVGEHALLVEQDQGTFVRLLIDAPVGQRREAVGQQDGISGSSVKRLLREHGARKLRPRGAA
jgi:hypothetical protein